MDTEVSFPRGGIKRTKRSEYASVVEDIFAPKKDKQKSTKTKNQSVSSRLLNSGLNNTELVSTTAEILTYEQIQENMLILACIRSISSFSIDVELPGKRYGKIKVNNISDQYVKFLQQKLEENDIGEEKDLARLNCIFQIGQFVPTKVLKKEQTENGVKVYLSMNPVDIHSDWNHTILQRGFLIWAAIESESDHGYQLDAGIKNCRVFLPHKNIKEETTFVMGQPMWCIVQKCDINAAASTITVSTLQDHLKTIPKNVQVNLHHIIPGMCFNFTVTKIIKNGLQGEFMNGCCGYINENYLASPMDRMAKYKEGQTVKAYFLYIQPTTKFSYLSMRDLNTVPAPEYSLGTITQSKILSKTGGGLNINLPNNEKGFVSFKRIANVLSKKHDLNDAISKKYPKGSSHQCRILDYFRLEQVYICTFEQSLLKEKIFVTSDVKLGQLVDVTVKSLTREGLVVRLGKLNAFIHNIHLSNVAYSENIKKKFAIGKTLQARVWSIDDKGIYLTHKQAFLKSDLCLTKIDNNIANHQYPGLVAKISSNGVLVIFYGNIRGWISMGHLNHLYGNDVDNMFYEGQVIMTTVKAVQKNSLSLVLDPPKPSKRKALKIGQYVTGIVSEINEDGLVIEVKPNNVKAFLHVNHLSRSLPLTSLLLKTYSLGDELKDLLCLANESTPILSLREGQEYKRRNLVVSKFEDMETGTLLRSSYKFKDESGIVLLAPFIPKPETLRINFDESVSDSEAVKNLSLQPQQAVILKVTKTNVGEHKEFNFSINFDSRLSGDWEDIVNYFEQYMHDIKRIQLHLLKEKSLLTKLNLGQRVECLVRKVKDRGCAVVLENGVRGFVFKEHYSKTLKPNQKIMGVVLWVDYKKEFVHVSCLENVINKVNSVQDISTKKSLNLGSTCVHADVLIFDEDIAVAVIRNKEMNGQLIFLPRWIHENALYDSITYNILQKIKVVICRKVDEKLIGVDKKMIHEFEKIKNQNNRLKITKKRKRAELLTVANKKTRLDFNGTNSFKNANHVSFTEESEGSVKESEDDICQEEGENEEEVEENYEKTASQTDSDEINASEREASTSDEEVPENDVGDEIGEIAQEESDSDDDNDEDEVDRQETEEDSENESNANVIEEENGYDSDADEFTVKNTSKNTETNRKSAILQNQNKISSALPGIQKFFAEEEKQVQFDDSSDEETTEQEAGTAKKKKLTPAERRELARQEEERLRRKELEIADCTVEPQSEEQFNMLVMGKPNCSELWAKYIAYYVSNGEIQKARNIAETALSRIDFKEIEEKYNIWIILLNLENNYGDKESFNKVFTEAVRCNDDLRIYLDVINMLADSQKWGEMEEKVKKLKRKYKQEPKMWHAIIKLYYKIGQFKEARNLLHAAVKVIPKTQSADLVVQCGIMEFQFGEKNIAEALFESAVNRDPKRVDIWCTYVDQVVKKDDIQGARRILDRAVSQSIHYKKKNTLFKKYYALEKKHGTKETIKYVSELIQKYMQESA